MHKKLLLLILILAIIVSGCNSTNNRIQQLEQHDECTTSDDCEEGSLCFGGKCQATIYECLTDIDCEEGYHCSNAECLNNEIFEDFEDCSYDNPECEQTCINCNYERTGGKYTCLLNRQGDVGTNGRMEIQKCVECQAQWGCKEGYVCKEYVCVEE